MAHVLKENRRKVCFCFSSQRRFVLSCSKCSRKKAVNTSQDWAHRIIRSEKTLTDHDDEARSGAVCHRGENALVVDSSSQESLASKTCRLRIMDNHRNSSSDRKPRTTTVQERLPNRRPSSTVGNVSVRRKPTGWPHRGYGYNRGPIRGDQSTRSFRPPRNDVAGACGPLTFRRRRPSFEMPHWTLQFIQRRLVEFRLNELGSKIPFRTNRL